MPFVLQINPQGEEGAPKYYRPGGLVDDLNLAHVYQKRVAAQTSAETTAGYRLLQKLRKVKIGFLIIAVKLVRADGKS